MVDESCNSIPRIEFCFEINTKNAKNNNIVLSILLGSIDSVAPDGTSFLARVFANAVISTPVNCDPELSSTKDNISVCCQSEQINVSLPTQTLQQINAFGIELPPDHIFLEYNDSENVVETFVGTGLDFHGALTDQQFRFPLQANGHFMNLSLRFLRFVIEQSPVQDSNTETVILGTVLPTVGGLITLSLLSITVLIIAIKRRKMKKMVLSKDPQKTFDNANC